jgi:hypothetical protein
MMMIRIALLATTSALLIPAAAGAQTAPSPPWASDPAPVTTGQTGATAASVSPSAAQAQGDSPDGGEDGGDIVVTGQKPRGSVVGDIPPENTLSSRDIRATGATSITELLAAIAPQTGSARGRGGEGPVLLLNGQRISGFQEIRDLPPEAIERVEILPEEVALKYGYSADQRVVNMVLRRRFRSTAVRGDAGIATDGGYATGLADVSRLMIGSNGRTQATLHAEANSALGENERQLVLQPLPNTSVDPRDYRTLVGSQKSLRSTVVANRTVLGDVSATGNLDVSHSEGTSLFGVPSAGPGGGYYPTFGPLDRIRKTDTAHAGVTLNGQKARWRWSLLGNGDVAHTVTNSDRGVDVSGATPVEFPRDRSRSTRTAAGIDGTLNGPLATLPAGRANVTLKAGVDTLHLDSLASRAGLTNSARLGRDHAVGSVNIDLPIAKRGGALGAIGSLTLNANAAVDHYSDFGTTTSLGAGANWSPAPRLNFITSFTREEGVPSINNLGDPILTTPGTRVFDYSRGTTVLVTATTGGNPALLADRRKVWKLGANWQPWEKTDLRLRADFVSSRLTNPVQTFPGPSPVIEAAFPTRFIRDGQGNLTAVDFRPVNYDSARSEVVRIGFDFTKPLKSAAPPQALIDQFRRMRAQAGGGGRPADGGDRGGDRGPDRGGGGFGGRGGGGGGGPFGGGQRGRLTFSLTDTVALVDKAVIRQGLPDLNFLNGSASSGGSGGGRARHTIEAQAGYFNNGLGARFSANYRTATRVGGGPNGDLDFAPLATFDLRLFANLGDNLALLAKHPWLRGTSIRLEANNLLNERPRVRDNYGMVPAGYQQDLLDPIGRTVSISIRKLFIPSRFFQRARNQQRS